MAAEGKDIQARRQLLLSFPDLEIGHDSGAVVDALVEGAIYAQLRDSGRSTLVTAGQIVAKIMDLAALEYETVEVIASFERLVRKGIATMALGRHDSIAFSETRLAVLRLTIDEQLEAEELVKEDWFNGLRERHSLDREQLDELWETLLPFISAMVNTHAAEAAAYLYIARDEDQVRFYDILNSNLPVIEDFVDATLLAVALQEFPRFFQTGKQLRIDYLSALLRGSFFYHLLAIDPQASQLVRGSVSDKTLYLDSNVIYRLLGLQGPALMYAPAKALDIANQLGCKLVVTGETVDEFLHTLRRESERVRSIPIERRAYQELVTQYPTDEWAFMYAYYQERLSGRIKSVDEFERKYSNIAKYLKDWGVEIEEDAVLDDNERAQESFKDRLSELNQWHFNQKSPTVLEHDVYMLRLVRAKRGPTDRTAGSTEHWFLTHDRKLTRFAVYFAKSGMLPECLLADTWLQIARPFLPRTDDYQKSLITVLQHPLLYYHGDAVPFDHIVQSLHRLERYEEIPTSVLAALIADGEFIRHFRKAPDEAAEREILESKLAKVAKEAAERTADLEQNLERTRAQVEVLREQFRIEQRDRLKAEKEKEEAIRTGEHAIVSTGAQYEADIKALKAELTSDLNSLRKEFGQRIRWIVYGAAVAFLGAMLSTSFVVRPTMTGMELTLLGGWFIIASALLLGIPLKSRIGTVATIVAVVGTLLGLIGLSYQLIRLGERQSPTDAPTQTESQQSQGASTTDS